MPDITCCTYVTTGKPGEPLPPVCSVPVPPKPDPRKTKGIRKLVPSYFVDYLIGWYGSTTLQQISVARRDAMSKNRTLYRIDVVVDGANYAPSRQHLHQLGDLGVIHVDTLAKETETFVLERLGVSGPLLSERYAISEFIWRHPARLGDLWKIPELSRLNAAIFSASAGGGDARVYYAAIHPRRIKTIRPPPNCPRGTKLKIEV